MKRITMMSVLLIGATGCVVESHATDWNQWRGPNRDGVAPNSPPLIANLPDKGLKPVWVSENIPSQRAGGWGSPVVANGKVYLYSHQSLKKENVKLPERKWPWLPPEKHAHRSKAELAEYEKNRRDEDEMLGKMGYDVNQSLYCIDARTGKTLWRTKIDSLYTRFVQSGTVTVVDGRVLVLGPPRTAHCFDADTGKLLWATRLPGDFRDEHFQSSFAVADGVAVALVGHLFGLDVETGKILWEGDKRATSGDHSSPAVWNKAGESYFIVNVNRDETICVEPRTGRELWRVQTLAGKSTPVIVGNKLVTFGASRKGGVRCFAMTEKGAKELWKYQGAGDPGSSPVVLGGHVYVQGERNLACVSMKDGKEQWKTLLSHKDPRFTSLLAADNKIFYACEGVLCFSADPKGFRPLYDAKVNAAGLMATEDTYRKRLGLDAIEKSGPEGYKKADKLYEAEVGKSGPAKCTTPAFVNGRLFVRTGNELMCYDLRSGPND
ncbi:MAG: PQQ-binding-like beta-propeller repeat protein [Planctomycetota bacterium]|jgi:outer membrane protein assembly factor BamB